MQRAVRENMSLSRCAQECVFHARASVRQVLPLKGSQRPGSFRATYWSRLIQELLATSYPLPLLPSKAHISSGSRGVAVTCRTRFIWSRTCASSREALLVGPGMFETMVGTRVAQMAGAMARRSRQQSSRRSLQRSRRIEQPPLQSLAQSPVQ